MEITEANILANPWYPWDWTLISLSPNLTTEFILNNPAMNWNWDYIASNPNIGQDFAQKHRPRTD